MADAGPEPTYDEKLEYPHPPGERLGASLHAFITYQLFKGGSWNAGEGDQAFVERVLEGPPSP